MSEQLITALVAVITGIIGLAALSVLVSPHAQTGNVIRAGSSGLATDISAAVSPVTGGSSGGLGAWPGPSMSGGFGSGIG